MAHIVDWTDRFRVVLDNSNLAKVGLECGLGDCMNSNPRNPVVISRGLAATAVEAVCGAVYKDGGLDALGAVMQHLGIWIPST